MNLKLAIRNKKIGYLISTVSLCDKEVIALLTLVAEDMQKKEIAK